MGGSKCTYRNCTVRSGQQNVHMFHYPVYDKNRCHQWLANAQKFEFLNLKLSQLRNRIVCQHHFKDECFMNYLKDKLIFDAIPTEDGPFSAPSTQNEEVASTPSFVHSIILNDFDAEDKYIKKHKSSIIYADFLTNGDIYEKQALNETIWNNKVLTDKVITPSVNKAHIDVLPKNNLVEDSLITLPKNWPESTSTKISKFENPILSDENYRSNDFPDQTSKFISSRGNKANKRKDLRSCRVSDNEFDSLLVNKQPMNTVAIKNRYNNNNQDLNDLLLNQENNNVIANSHNLNTSNNIICEQISDIKWPDKENERSMYEQKSKNLLQPTEMQYTEISAYPNHEKSICVKSSYGAPIVFEPTNNLNNINQHYKDYSVIDSKQENQSCDDQINKRKRPKIQILFEEKITEPITITDKLDPVSPSLVINASSKKQMESHLPLRRKTLKPKIRNFNENIQVSASGKEACENVKNSSQTTTQMNVHSEKNENQIEIIPKLPPIKHKIHHISPERSAAIEKKRNFNKKLRDIIEICLEKLDEQDKTNESNTNISKEKVPVVRVNDFKQNVGVYLSKHDELPNVQEYTMKYMEARLQRMENILLNKIEQNSKKIVELKNCIVSKPQSSKSAATQTCPSEESYKKHLYQEMSKFLSPNANSLLYEELFINKYSQKNSSQPTPKRRKRR